jgi:DNA invertase Pin-like site-specific DNA recombinase
MRAIGYVRCSTSKQDLSPAAQCHAIERWASAEGASLIAVYVDVGVSGAAELDERPGLARALGSLRSHDASMLVVAKRDRLARDVVIAKAAEGIAARANARIVSADGMGNTNDEGGELTRDIFAVLAAHERRQIAARTRAALAVKRSRGERTGCIPFGMQLAADGVHVEPNASEQHTITRAKELSDTGLSLRAITAQLNEEGHTNRVGRPLAFQTVHNFLRPLLF